MIKPPYRTATVSVNAESTRKLFRVAQMESVRSRLRSVKDSCVSYKEFIRICEECCTDRDQAKLVAKMLDDSASVVVGLYCASLSAIHLSSFQPCLPYLEAQ